MRILPSDEQQLRKEKVLQAVIHLYINTGKPVGSSSVVDNFRMNLSPATIRNVLADLEREGYLTHPHTSAGRIPTDKGYRFYVDAIADTHRLAAEEMAHIQSEYARRIGEISDLMRSTTRVLSALSHCTGFALQPRFDQERLRRVELIPVSDTQLLGVLVSESGLVHNQMMSVDHAPEERDLRFASQFLSERLAGLGFTEAQARFVSELQTFHARHAEQRAFLERLSHGLFDVQDTANLFVEGAGNILNFPEFQDHAGMRSFAHLMDEKKTLVTILNKEITHRGLSVRIGAETSPELKDFSVVSSCYILRGRPVGILGILGPKRMEYERMMAIVDTVARLVNGFLEQSGDRLLEDQR